jgi:hypothetical protein
VGTVAVAARSLESPPLPSEEELRREILRLADQRGPTKSLCPSEVARALSPNADWRPLMPAIRGVALELIAAGQIRATQKGRTINLDEARGPVRLRAVLPQ